MNGASQEYAIARFREDAARNDPPFYSLGEPVPGLRCVWLNLRGNVGWYWAKLQGEVLVGFHALAFGGHDNLLDLLIPKQRRKITALYRCGSARLLS